LQDIKALLNLLLRNQLADQFVLKYDLIGVHLLLIMYCFEKKTIALFNSTTIGPTEKLRYLTDITSG